MEKLSAKCRALRENLKTVGVRNAKEEKSNNLLKQNLAVCKVYDAKKREADGRLVEDNDQLLSKLQQVEHDNQYLAEEYRRKIRSMMEPRSH